MFLVLLCRCAGCTPDNSRRHHSHSSLSEWHSLELCAMHYTDGPGDILSYDGSMVSNNSS